MNFLRRNLADVALCMLVLVGLWVIWPFAVMLKFFGVKFPGFIITLTATCYILFLLYWNFERVCDHSKVGFLSPVDGVVEEITQTEIDGNLYHKITIRQKMFDNRAIYSPTSNEILVESNPIPTLRAPGKSFIQKFTQKSIKISFDGCFLVGEYNFGVPFIWEASGGRVNQEKEGKRIEVIAGTVIGSSNFCFFGAIFELYAPKEPNETKVWEGRTVIGGETTLIKNKAADPVKKRIDNKSKS